MHDIDLFKKLYSLISLLVLQVKKHSLQKYCNEVDIIIINNNKDNNADDDDDYFCQEYYIY